MPETPLITYLRIQRAQDREMLAALRSAASSVDVELRRLQNADRIGDAMRREQLRRSQAAINNRLARLWDELGDAIEANKARAAAAGAESVLRESKSVLRSVLSEADYDYMLRSAQESAERGLETLSQRVSGSSYVPLSESVYDNAALTQGKVDDIVNSALARGASAAELARDVRQFIDPNTPGGLRYASMRLGRTELNNAFHAAQIKQAQDEPWTLAVRWHLSGSHPRPDACNDYADDVHFKGGEPGQWKPEEVPAKPHPNCLCYTTPETMEPDEFIDAYARGDFDKYLDDELGVPEPDSGRGYIQGRDLSSSTDWSKVKRDSSGFQTEDRMALRMMKEQGFDGLPTKVSREEAQRMVDQGGVRMARGLTSEGGSADDFVKQFVDGPEPFIGHGVHGSGSYFATDIETAHKYASMSNGGRVIEGVLRPGARVIDESDMHSWWNDEAMLDILIKHPDSMYNVGAMAIARGYDAIRVASRGEGTYLVVLNRTAVSVIA